MEEEFIQLEKIIRKYLRKNKIPGLAISIFKETKADSLISGSILDDFLIWEKKDDAWRAVNYDPKNRGRRQDRDPQFVENGSIFIFQPESIRKHNNRIGGNLELYKMAFWQSWQIDAPDDIDLIEYYLNTRIKRHIDQDLSKEEIDLIVLDFDGVLTNNQVLTLQDGTEGILANRADGLAVEGFKKLNIPMTILSTETNPVVEARARKIGLPVIQGAKNKKSVLSKYLKEKAIDPDRVLFLGNDVNDLEAMQLIGWPVCPADAHESIMNISKIVLDKKGGEGVFRALYEYFTQSNGDIE